MRKAIFLLLVLFLPLSALAEESPWTRRGGHGQTEVELYLFWSLNCPHCLAAHPQILDFVRRNPWIHLHDHEVSKQPENVRRFVELAKQVGQEAQAVPTLIFCGQMEVGWDDSPQALRRLISRLEACRGNNAGPKDQTLSSSKIVVPLIGEVDSSRLSLPLLTLLIAGLDAFNPCAFFVLLFLLSMLVHQQSRWRMLIIGGVFVAISGLMYFAFMAAWLNLFWVVGSLPWVTAAAGLLALLMGVVNVMDFVRFREGITLAIPEGRKADIFQRARGILAASNLPAMIVMTVVLATAANFYELLCTAGFPMVFTRVLTLQETSPAQHYLYLAWYNVIYVLPLLAIVVAFVHTMGARKLSEREGRLLKLLSGLMMGCLGILLLLAPDTLGHIELALALPAIAIGLTWLATRWTRR